MVLAGKSYPAFRSSPQVALFDLELLASVFTLDAASQTCVQEFLAASTFDDFAKPLPPFSIESGHDIQDPLERVDGVDIVAPVNPDASKLKIKPAQRRVCCRGI